MFRRHRPSIRYVTCSNCEGMGFIKNEGRHKSPLRWYQMQCSECRGTGKIPFDPVKDTAVNPTEIPRGTLKSEYAQRLWKAQHD